MKYRLALFAIVLHAQAQTPQQPLKFEVASVKITPELPRSTDRAQMMRDMAAAMPRVMNDSKVNLGNIQLNYLVATAYEVRPYQVTGPDWMSSLHLDVQANLPEGGKKEQIPAMLQALLAERLGLKVHRGAMQATVFALTVANGGPKLQEAPPSDKPLNGAGMEDFHMNTANGAIRYSFTGSMLNLAGILTTPTREVEDHTGLKGRYKITFDTPTSDLLLSRPQSDQGDAASNPDGVSVYASAAKLGLKLEQQKVSKVQIVVDHAEKTPTANQ